jgi:hypothetical protein
LNWRIEANQIDPPPARKGHLARRFVALEAFHAPLEA